MAETQEVRRNNIPFRQKIYINKSSPFCIIWPRSRISVQYNKHQLRSWQLMTIL